MYDKKQFSERLHELRKSRWKQYKSSKPGDLAHNEKFAFCQTQETLAEKLGVERRAVSAWETGSNAPSLDNLVNLCDLLECNIDYLLGANEYADISPVVLASHFSGIKPEIIRCGLDNSQYLECLNFFMHPDNCSALFNDMTLAAWKKYIVETQLSDIYNPLKEVVVDAFNVFYAFTDIKNSTRDKYKEFLSSAFRRTYPDCDEKGLKEIAKTYLSEELFKKMYNGKRKLNYDDLISHLTDYTYEPLTQRSYLELQETKLSKSFIKLFEDYLEKE